MKKIALVTLQGNENIGNRLQNYALQTLLERRKATVYNLWPVINHNPYELGKRRLKILLKLSLGMMGDNKYRKWSIYYRGHSIREKSIRNFSDAFIHNIVYTSYDNTVDDYDLGIVGSDQVWHRWNDDINNDSELNYYYLNFLPDRKRASYAASFGFTRFPDRDRNLHIKRLNEMRFISCREREGCNLVKDVTGREVVHVLDPTLLIAPSEWRMLEKNINDYSKALETHSYAFVYFLGTITDEYKEYIHKICSKFNINTIVDFMDFNNNNIASCGPEDFVFLIDHATYVFTDSFHCSVFSILFKKNFVAFPRYEEGFTDMFGRIEELLEMTGNTERMFCDFCERGDIESFEDMKKKSLDYLDMILKS